MSDLGEIQRLHEYLASDEAKLEELLEREAKLLQAIPQKGFRAASERRHLLSEIQMLEGSIRANQNRLAMAKH
jgi:hypothetical protein